MQLSVALCTYNGSAYIQEQLVSIISQSFPVNEVVICDDGSTDLTIKIIESVIADSPIPIRLYKNDSPLGVIANFDKAVSLCSGDIIFLCDQDDVWSKDKVKTIVNWFGKHPEKSVVFTDAELIDDHGYVIPNSSGLFNAIGFDKKIRRYFNTMAFDIFLKYNRATGATMAVKKEFFNNFKIHHGGRNEGIPLHDAQLALAAICKNELAFISDKLISYRIHSSQECGLGLYVNKPRKESIYNMYYSKGCLTIPEIEDKIDFLKKKADYRNSIFGLDVLKHTREYHEHYRRDWLLFYLHDFFHGLKRTIITYHK